MLGWLIKTLSFGGKTVKASEGIDARIAEAQARLRAGEFHAAAQICGEILRGDPGNAEALHVAVESVFGGADHGQVVEWLRSAIAARPLDADPHYKLGCVLEDCGRPDDAIEAYRNAVKLDPGFAKAHNNLGSLLEGRGLAEQALDCYQTALRLDPNLWQPHYNIGNFHKLAGRLDRAVRPYLEAVRLKRPAGKAEPVLEPTFSMTSRSKLLHDIEQLEYLMERGILARNHGAIVDAYRDALEALAGAFERGHMAAFPPELLARVAPAYNRLVNFYEAQALAGPAVNPALDRASIEASYFRNGPGIVYVDNLLTLQALHELRRFCLESTVWFDYRYSDGYLGAYVEDGFICPLLAQIAAELPRALPGIFGANAITHLWGYKYDSSLSGINIHGDFAAVNVNFWITPDEANLEPGSGGLVVWDKEAPADWDFDTYNKDVGKIQGFLDASGAKAVTVPHRQNRAMIFNSDLFHKTDTLRFRPGYQNRRINITMLYGHRTGK